MSGSSSGGDRDTAPEGAAEAPRARRAVTVVISGRQYRIVSDADAQWLQSVATGVDETMALVRDRTETVDSLDVAVLTALNLARELVLLREQSAAAADAAREGSPAQNDGLPDRARLETLIDLAESAVGREPSAVGREPSAAGTEPLA